MEASELLESKELDKVMVEALSFAIREKRAQINKAAYSKKVLMKYQPKQYSWEEFFGIAMNDGKDRIAGFLLDSEETKIYEQLARYFTNDSGFKGSLKKGLMLYGNIGCGKTTALKIFQANPKQSYAMYSCRKVSDEFITNGPEALMRYTGMLMINQPELYYGQKSVGVCYDDLGTEQSAKFFGNDRNVMAEILLSRYDIEQYSGYNMHLTTNLSGDQIKEYYGARVASRMKEMFNIIEFPANSKDKRK